MGLWLPSWSEFLHLDLFSLLVVRKHEHSAHFIIMIFKVLGHYSRLRVGMPHSEKKHIIDVELSKKTSPCRE